MCKPNVINLVLKLVGLKPYSVNQFGIVACFFQIGNSSIPEIYAHLAPYRHSHPSISDPHLGHETTAIYFLSFRFARPGNR